MKKETIIAIFFGVLIGGIVAFVLIAKNKEKQLENTKTIAPDAKNTPITKVTNPSIQSLEILVPQDRTIVDSNKVTIKGKADKDSTILIESPINDAVFKNEKGEFSYQFPLALGENTIKITAYSKDPKFKPQEKELKIYYLEEQL